MTLKRVCIDCNTLVKLQAVGPKGASSYECQVHGIIPLKKTRPVSKHYGAKKGWHIKTWITSKRRKVLTKQSRRRNRS